MGSKLISGMIVQFHYTITDFGGSKDGLKVVDRLVEFRVIAILWGGNFVQRRGGFIREHVGGDGAVGNILVGDITTRS